MNGETFERISKQQIEKCFDTLNAKATEYSAGQDRLHNFKLAAELQQCNPKKALAGMMVKHVVSVFDMCMSEQIFPSTLWDEKINDTINYLLLLKALELEEKSTLTRDYAEISCMNIDVEPQSITFTKGDSHEDKS